MSDFDFMAEAYKLAEDFAAENNAGGWADVLDDDDMHMTIITCLEEDAPRKGILEGLLSILNEYIEGHPDDEDRGPPEETPLRAKVRDFIARGEAMLKIIP